MTAVRADVAAMLRAGATYAQIKKQLHVSAKTITHTRRTLDIPIPAGRRLSPERKAAIEARTIELLQAGATYRQIAAELGITAPTIAAIRKRHDIPLTPRDYGKGRRRTIAEGLAHHTTPTDDGHLLWTGPYAGRSPALFAEGHSHNARHITFRTHHGRDPEGHVWRTPTCTEPTCIAGAHLTDQTIRTAEPDPIDDLYDAIFGPGATP